MPRDRHVPVISARAIIISLDSCLANERCVSESWRRNQLRREREEKEARETSGNDGAIRREVSIIHIFIYLLVICYSLN